MEPLKLYVWEDVLSDYKAGVMFAFAKNVWEARECIEAKMGYIHEDLLNDPREIEEKEGFYIFGSM